MLEKSLLPAKVLRVVTVRLRRGCAVDPRVVRGLNQSIMQRPHLTAGTNGISREIRLGLVETILPLAGLICSPSAILSSRRLKVPSLA